MSRIHSSENRTLPITSPTLSSPIADRNTSYANYVAQIEANKGAQLSFSPFKNVELRGNNPLPIFGAGSNGGGSFGSNGSIFAGIGSHGGGPLGGNSGLWTAPPKSVPAGPDPQRLSNAYRYVAAYNHIDPQQLATNVPISQLAAKSPVMDGHNLFNDYINGVASTPITPVTSGSMLGASSQGTGNFLDNTPSPDTLVGATPPPAAFSSAPAGAAATPPPVGSPQSTLNNFATGGLIGGQPQMNGPMLSNYATGGMVGQPPAGLAPPMQGGNMPMAAGAQQAPVNPQMFHNQAQDLLNQHPEVKQQIQQAVQQALASGQLTMQEAQMGVQLCQAVINNPALWPQLRAFAIQNGLAGENDIPQQYDQGLVMAILIAAKAVGVGQNGQQSPAAGAGGPQGRFATGGMIVGPGSGTSDSIKGRTDTGESIKVSNGEYIIPKSVVLAKGTDFFDKMIASYNEPSK